MIHLAVARVHGTHHNSAGVVEGDGREVEDVSAQGTDMLKATAPRPLPWLNPDSLRL